MKYYVKTSAISEEDLKCLKKSKCAEFKKWILSHPGKTIIDLQIAKKVPIQFINNHTICMNCGHIELKAMYALAHSGVTFTCKCGHKTLVS